MDIVFRRTGWILMTTLCVMLALTTLHYFGSDTSTYFQPDIYVDRIVILRVHIAAGITAVLTGPFQFWGAIRTRFPAVHRALGKLYIAGVLTSAASGLVMATTALGGVVTQGGFSTLAILWAGTTLMAYRRILARDIAGHRRWMIRSFALTFAFVMLRAIFPVLKFGAGFDQTTAYQITSWACWIPNLVIVELALRHMDNSNRSKPDATAI